MCDAHLANFGLYASPERKLVFDINDFDETLEGPWEWDLKRLVASLAIAGRHNNQLDRDKSCRATKRAVQSYRESMNDFLGKADHLVIARHLVGVFSGSRPHSKIDHRILRANHFGNAAMFRRSRECDLMKPRRCRLCHRGSAAAKSERDLLRERLRDERVPFLIQVDPVVRQGAFRICISLTRQLIKIDKARSLSGCQFSDRRAGGGSEAVSIAVGNRIWWVWDYLSACVGAAGDRLQLLQQ